MTWWDVRHHWSIMTYHQFMLNTIPSNEIWICFCFYFQLLIHIHFSRRTVTGRTLLCSPGTSCNLPVPIFVGAESGQEAMWWDVRLGRAREMRPSKEQHPIVTATARFTKQDAAFLFTHRHTIALTAPHTHGWCRVGVGASTNAAHFILWGCRRCVRLNRYMNRQSIKINVHYQVFQRLLIYAS